MAVPVYGDISVRIGGARYQTRGTMTIMKTAFERSANANNDGKIYVTETPVAPMATVDFEVADWTWDDRMMRRRIDVTIREISNGKQRIITDAVMVGRPSVDVNTGQVTGVSIAWDRENYQEVG